jgi:hypothetical protein
MCSLHGGIDDVVSLSAVQAKVAEDVCSILTERASVVLDASVNAHVPTHISLGVKLLATNAALFRGLLVSDHVTL